MIGAHEGTLIDGCRLRSSRSAPSAAASRELDLLIQQVYRSRRAWDRRFRGIGLWLLMVKAVSDAHHGTLDVVSALGEGMTFTLKLRVSGPSDEAAE